MEKKNLSDLGKSARTGKKMLSTKMKLKCPDFPKDAELIPKEVRDKIKEIRET